MNKIDTRGMSCPQPVLMTKNALKTSPEKISVLVDNNTAKENVRRFLSSAGYSVNIESNEDDFILEGKK